MVGGRSCALNKFPVLWFMFGCEVFVMSEKVRVVQAGALRLESVFFGRFSARFSINAGMVELFSLVAELSRTNF